MNKTKKITMFQWLYLWFNLSPCIGCRLYHECKEKVGFDGMKLVRWQCKGV